MNRMSAVSLFAGVGGIDLAARRAGIETRLLCEIDKPCRRVLARRFPEAVIHDDVRTLTADDLRRAGLVPDRTVAFAGFPCQDVSVAGRRKGMGEGTRTGLFWHVDRLLAEFRPAWVVLENVAGLLSATCACPGDGRCGAACAGEEHQVKGGACGGQCIARHGGVMGAVLGSLANRGYGFAYRVLDAQFFGVPQRRRRVVIVGRLGDSGVAPAQVLLEPEGCERDSAASTSSWPEVAAEAGYGLGVAGEPGGGTSSRAHRRTVTALTSNGVGTCGADDNQAQAGHLLTETFQKVIRPATADHPDVWEHRDVAATLSPFDLGSDSRAVEILGDKTHTLTAEAHAAGIDAQPSSSVAPTMKAGHDSMPSVATETTVRRLTPLECERLQGFPDNWTEGQSDAQRYKQMGNSVAVPVFTWTLRRLVAVDARLAERAA